MKKAARIKLGELVEHPHGRRRRLGVGVAALALPLAAVTLGASPVHAAPATWTPLVSTSYPGYAAGESYSLRGVALSPDASTVYGSWLHTGTGIVIDEYDATTGALLSTTALSDAANGGAANVPAKALATDARGYVFAGSGDTGGPNDYPFIQAFSADLSTAYAPARTIGNPSVEHKRFGGLATWYSGGTYYLYATREGGSGSFYIQRFIANDVNDITLDPSFGVDGTVNLADLPGLSTAGHPHGIAVASDGTLYVASFDEGSPDADAAAATGALYKVAPDGSSASYTAVPGAFDVTLAGVDAYVSQYGESDSGAGPAVAVVDTATMAITSELSTGYTNTNPSRDSGYSGIAISPQGSLYLADEFYSATSYSDMLLVSPPQPVPPTSKDQCKKGGWHTFTNPTFKNQGDCVSYVATHGRNPGNG